VHNATVQYWRLVSDAAYSAAENCNAQQNSSKAAKISVPNEQAQFN